MEQVGFSDSSNGGSRGDAGGDSSPEVAFAGSKPGSSGLPGIMHGRGSGRKGGAWSAGGGGRRGGRGGRGNSNKRGRIGQVGGRDFRHLPPGLRP